MTNIIDKQYFWGGLALSNLSEEEELNELDRYIAKYQKEYLTVMFGAAIALDTPDAIIDLLVDTDTLTSPIANYVYFHFRRDNATMTTTVGEKKTMISKTSYSSSNEKLVAAWNEMARWSGELHNQLFAHEIEVPDIDYHEEILPKVKFTHDIFYEINEFNL